MFILFLYILLYFFLINSFLIHLNLFLFSKINLRIRLNIDYFIIFFLTIIIIILCIYFYCKFYIRRRKIIIYFIIILLIFSLSIIILVFSERILIIFIGWDGLGISSYLLVIFFLNWKCNNSGYVTILTNRLGDGIFLFVLFFLILNTKIYLFNLKLFSSLFLRILVLIFCLTKRAQYPFSFWLPIAIAAPTPVSSLVHSSTLVTAGVVVFLRYFEILNSYIILILLFISRILTLIIRGLISLKEIDLKKIVALSTLRQISFIFISLSQSLKILCFFHLRTHALFKRLLFLNVGVLIHNSFNLQDKRSYRKIINRGNLILISILLRILNLLGFFFISGFLSKDLILEQFLIFNIRNFIIFIFYFLIIFTFFYSFIILKTVIINTSKIKNIFQKRFLRYLFSLLILRLSSVLFGKIFFLNWQNLFFCIFFLRKLKIDLIILLLIRILFINNKYFLLIYNNFLTNIFYLKNITYFWNFYLKILRKNIKNLLEKSWLEIFHRKIYLKFLYFFLFKKKEIYFLNFNWRIKLIILFLFLFFFIFCV